MAKRGYKDHTGIAMSGFEHTIRSMSKAEMADRKTPITAAEQIADIKSRQKTEARIKAVQKKETVRFIPLSRAYYGFKD